MKFDNSITITGTSGEYINDLNNLIYSTGMECVKNKLKIIINDYVFFGTNVSIIAGTHNYNKFGYDRHPSSACARTSDCHVIFGLK